MRYGDIRLYCMQSEKEFYSLILRSTRSLGHEGVHRTISNIRLLQQNHDFVMLFSGSSSRLYPRIAKVDAIIKLDVHAEIGKQLRTAWP